MPDYFGHVANPGVAPAGNGVRAVFITMASMV
jgi:hypothetical protein